MQLSKARIEAIFTQWHREWTENPGDYYESEEHFGLDHEAAGKAATEDFLRIHHLGVFV